MYLAVPDHSLARAQRRIYLSDRFWLVDIESLVDEMRFSIWVMPI